MKNAQLISSANQLTDYSIIENLNLNGQFSSSQHVKRAYPVHLLYKCKHVSKSYNPPYPVQVPQKLVDPKVLWRYFQMTGKYFGASSAFSRNTL